MKAALFDSKGASTADIELPALFARPIREDLVAKYVEATKFASRQPYATYKEAGKRHSASGTISHKRHEWKGHYGKGIARLPRKSMWRRGTQFYWVGAEVSNTRGGRVAHPPSGLTAFRKINKKEQEQAFHGALAATMSSLYIKKRYATLTTPRMSAVIESLPGKTKELFATLKNIFGNAFSLVIKQKAVRAGKGKRRGRKYKANAGLLLVTGTNESKPFKGIDLVQAKELAITDLSPLGRLTLFTKQALKELA